MSAKINNFINLGIGNAGDGNESLPVYGVYWMDRRVFAIYEVNDINNPTKEIEDLKNIHPIPSIEEMRDIITKPIFIAYNNQEDYTFTDNRTNIVLDSPFFNICPNTGYIISIKDNREGIADVLTEFNINKGIIIGFWTNDPTDGDTRTYFTFIVAPTTYDDQKVSGFGSVLIDRY